MKIITIFLLINSLTNLKIKDQKGTQTVFALMNNDLSLFHLSPDGEFDMDNVYRLFMDCYELHEKQIKIHGISSKICQGTDELSLTQTNLFLANFILTPLEVIET